MAAAPSVSGDEVPAVTVPCSSKASFEPGEPLERGVGARAAVARDGAALAVIGTISSSKLPAGLRRGGLLLRGHRELLLALARDAVLLRQVLRRLAHRGEGLWVALEQRRVAAAG